MAPDTLSDAARSTWERLAPEMHRLGLLTELDRDLFSAFCEATATWEAANRDIAERGLYTTTPNGYVVQSAAVNIRNKAARDVAQFAGELGLSAISRNRLAKTVETPPEFDKFKGTLCDGIHRKPRPF